MEALKKYWWLMLLVPVVLYMVYVLTKETNEKPKPGSIEYARKALEEKRMIKANDPDNGRDNSESKEPIPNA